MYFLDFYNVYSFRACPHVFLVFAMYLSLGVSCVHLLGLSPCILFPGYTRVVYSSFRVCPRV